MEKYNLSEIPKSSRITRLVDHLYAKMPEIESYRAKLITESYKETEDQPIITRRAKAFSHILHNIPIIIRDEELIVGSNSIAPRGCQTFPEFSFQWLEDELDTVETRIADPFYISEQAKADLREVHKYWKGKTTPTDDEFTNKANWALKFDHKNVRMGKITIPKANFAEE